MSIKPPTCACIIVTGYKNGSRTPERWPGFCPLHEAADDLLVALEELTAATLPLELAYGTKPFVTKLDKARAAAYRAQSVIDRARGTK